MYYYKIKGEKNRIRTCPDDQVRGDPYLLFAPAFYDYWSHKDENGVVDKVWVSETKDEVKDLLSED